MPWEPPPRPETAQVQLISPKRGVFLPLSPPEGAKLGPELREMPAASGPTGVGYPGFLGVQQRMHGGGTGVPWKQIL